MHPKSLLAGAALGLALPSLAWAAGMPCADFAKSGALSNTVVWDAVVVAAKDGLPEHCKISATIKPTPASNIGVEYILPTPANWNGKFLGLGGGGFGGVIREPVFAEGLKRGYAEAQTDIGHKESKGPLDGSWAFTADGKPNPDAVSDYDWRSVKLMTDVGKELVQKFYGEKPKYSYWQGCSTGGREGLLEAQRYPDDYDGVIAGAPVYTSRLQLGGIVRGEAMSRMPGSTIPNELYPVINKAVLGACDAQDGLADGYLTDPTKCKFDPAQLACKPGNAANSCLTPAQVETVKLVNKGSSIYPGTQMGGELDWVNKYNKIDIDRSIGGQMAKYMVFMDPQYDPLTFDTKRDLKKWDSAQVSKEGNAENPDVRAFVKRGGKMIVYHGFNDPGPSPLSTLKYVTAAKAKLGKDADKSLRLFMVPGMYHCRGGPGPDSFDALTALESWVEKGVPPASIRAENKAKGFTRPLCPYPEVAKYKGAGNQNDAANFACVKS
jgi:feruloyl esterase